MDHAADKDWAENAAIATQQLVGFCNNNPPRYVPRTFA